MIQVLYDKGAGRVIVGDQSGVEYVAWKQYIQRGSSRTFCEEASLFDVITENGAEASFFEKRGYNAYVACFPENSESRSEPMDI